MSRATFSRFNYTTSKAASATNGLMRAMRVVVLGGMCLGLSACMESSSLPELFTSIQDAGVAASVDDGTSVESKSKPRAHYVRKPTGVDSEALLEAKGNWNIVEQGGAMDPAQAHKLARESVNIRRRKTNKELSAHFSPDAKSGEDGKMRVLRLERGGSKYREDSSKFDIAESSVTKPTHTVAESDLMKKIKALFGEEDEGSKSLGQSVKGKPITEEDKARDKHQVVSGVVVPGRKPLKESLIKTANVEGHQIDGVVVPPALPAKKVVRASSVLLSQKKAESGAVVTPRVKPTLKIEAPTRKRIVPAAPGYVDVVKLRSGKHKGKTRLVIEVTEPTQYKVAIDHVRNVLRVKLDNARWAMAPQDKFEESVLLGTYIASGQRDGSTILEVRLRKPSEIIDTVLLRPNTSSQHRIVIDLKD